jgi:hypothetical protein
MPLELVISVGMCVPCLAAMYACALELENLGTINIHRRPFGSAELNAFRSSDRMAFLGSLRGFASCGAAMFHK